MVLTRPFVCGTFRRHRQNGCSLCFIISPVSSIVSPYIGLSTRTWKQRAPCLCVFGLQIAERWVALLLECKNTCGCRCGRPLRLLPLSTRLAHEKLGAHDSWHQAGVQACVFLPRHRLGGQRVPPLTCVYRKTASAPAVGLPTYA